MDANIVFDLRPCLTPSGFVSMAPPSSGTTTVNTPTTHTYYIAALLADFNVESIAYFDSGLCVTR